ncbi:hypothetical protein V6N11_012466 [Hibiscus sabdariffa]|uniref:Uncharacterized protein n=2 Tax=Hibiscus sabdariffa TaxID=183260 RepID=A0ABR2BF64_9ROSI
MKEVIVDKEVDEFSGGNSVFDEGLAGTQQTEPGTVVDHVVAESIEKSGEVVRGCELNEQHVMSQEANLQQVPKQLPCLVDTHEKPVRFEETDFGQKVVDV